MHPALPKRLLDAKEAAYYLSVSRATIYYWLQEGKLNGLKFGRRRLFDIRDLDAFVDREKARQIEHE